MSLGTQKRHDEVRKIVKSFQHYVATYDKLQGFEHYSDETIINDMLYGLGLALNEKEYKMAVGYRKFQDRLRKHLGCSKTDLGAWILIKED